MEAAIVGAKLGKPYWSARKIRERLLRRLPREIKVPARSTIQMTFRYCDSTREAALLPDG